MANTILHFEFCNLHCALWRRPYGNRPLKGRMQNAKLKMQSAKLRNRSPVLRPIMGLLLPHVALAASPPNVAMIISDDQGWTDFGFMGHEVIKTPHLDRLAAESAVFAN